MEKIMVETIWIVDKLAFISGPYRADTVHGIVENIRRAEQVQIEVAKCGYAVICPHKNSALLDGVLPDEYWLAADLVMLKRCDVCVFMKGWERSEGAKAERKFCEEHNIQILEEHVFTNISLNYLGIQKLRKINGVEPLPE